MVAEQFNGKFKLVSSEGIEAFLAATGEGLSCFSIYIYFFSWSLRVMIHDAIETLIGSNFGNSLGEMVTLCQVHHFIVHQRLLMQI